MIAAMFYKRFLRVFSARNSYLCQISYLRHGLNARNLSASAQVLESETEPTNVFDKERRFKFNYIVANYDFKYPLSDIINLNFAPSGKHESFKLLLQLQEDKDNGKLWNETKDSLNKELNTFDIEDFLKVMALCGKLSNRKDENWKNFLKDFIPPLDKELLSRKYSFEERLEILFVLKHTLLKQYSLKKMKFFIRIHRFSKHVKKLPPSQVVQFFYLFERFSEALKVEHKFMLLNYLKENLTLFNVDEMVIILSSLVKADLHGPSSDFISQITEKIVSEIDVIKRIHLLLACKYFAKSVGIYHSAPISNFQEKLIPHVSKFDADTLVSALLSNYPYSLNFSLWDKAMEKLKPEIKTLDIKNIERLALITTVFNVDCKEFLQLATEAFEGVPNFDENYQSIALFSRNLAVHGIYSEKLLETIFSENYIENMKKRCSFPEMTSWMFVRFSLEIDRPEHQVVKKNETLEKQIKKSLYGRRTDRGAFLFEKNHLKLLQFTEQLYGMKAVIRTYCLPHYRWGVVMRFDKNFMALDIPEEYRGALQINIRRPTDQQMWIFMNICKISPDDLTPMEKLCVRQTSAIGYIPIMVKLSEFIQSCSAGAQRTQDFIQTSIIGALQDASKKRKNNENVEQE